MIVLMIMKTNFHFIEMQWIGRDGRIALLDIDNKDDDDENENGKGWVGRVGFHQTLKFEFSLV